MNYTLYCRKQVMVHGVLWCYMIFFFLFCFLWLFVPLGEGEKITETQCILSLFLSLFLIMYCTFSITTVSHKQVDYWENVWHFSTHVIGFWLTAQIVLHKAIICFHAFPKKKPSSLHSSSISKIFFSDPVKTTWWISNSAPSLLRYNCLLCNRGIILYSSTPEITRHL